MVRSRTHWRDAGRLHAHTCRRVQVILPGVRFEGDDLPLVGVTAAIAKSLLRDVGNISYFASAFVNGIRVEAGHVLRVNDHLEFCQRFGFKGGTDLDREVVQAEALIRSEPELSKIVDEVVALPVPVERQFPLLVLRVLRWSENWYGRVTADAVGTLNHVLQRLNASLRERNRLVGLGDAAPDEVPEAPRIAVNIADGQLVVDGVRQAHAERAAEQLLNCMGHITPGHAPTANRSAPKGAPGRKPETLEIAEYANELRGAGKTWKQVLTACKRRWQDDSRVRNVRQVRATWDRHFGTGKSRH